MSISKRSSARAGEAAHVCRRSQARGGFTIIEAVISSTLLAILIVCFLTSFIQGLQFHAQLDDANALTTHAIAATTRLSEELRESHVATPHWDTNPPGVVFPHPAGRDGLYRYDTSGNLLWRTYVCYYVDVNSGRLIRKIDDIAGEPATPPAVPSTRYTNWFATASQPVTWSCSGVTSLTRVGTSDAPLGYNVHLSNAPLGAARANAMDIVTSVLPRN